MLNVSLLSVSSPSLSSVALTVKLKILNSNGKDSDTKIICAISTFSPQIFSPFSFPQKSPSPFSGRSPAFSALCLHFPARSPAFSGGDLLYFRQNSPFFGAVSTTDRALHFQRRLISARLNFLLKEALQR